MSPKSFVAVHRRGRQFVAAAGKIVAVAEHIEILLITVIVFYHRQFKLNITSHMLLFFVAISAADVSQNSRTLEYQYLYTIQEIV